MESGQPSRTALRAAQARALHQADPRRFFTDPLVSALLRVGPGEPDGIARLPDDPVDRYNLRFVAARSRFAEDALASAVASGTRQAVVLGAGLDTFAWRNPHDGLRVFEVDHPDTQQWKRQQAAAAGIGVPPSLAFVPVDFEGDALAGALDAAGLDRGRAAFFLWLGVTPYLTREAVLGTLRSVAAHAAPVNVVFDYYGEPSAALSPRLRAVREAATRMVAELGEPWLSFFAPDDIAGELRAMGLDDVEDVAGPDLLARYVGEPAVGVDAFGGHVIRAGRATARR